MACMSWSDSLSPDGLVFGNRLESQRAGNHVAVYFPVRKANKPIRFFTPLLKCKFAPSDEYNSVDGSIYAPANGNQDDVDDFVQRLSAIEEFVIQWAVNNANFVFSDFDPVPDEAAIRERFRSCVVDRISAVKFRLVPDVGCAYFDAHGKIDKDDARALFQTSNLPNIRALCEIKSVGVYNPTKRKGARVTFDGKLEVRLFALQLRILPPDDRDGTGMSHDVCMMPDEGAIV